MAKSQAALMSDVKLKSSHPSLKLKLHDMCRRLECRECKACGCDVYGDNLAVIEEATERVAVQQLLLDYRLGDPGDRSRRTNVIFHGISDSRETWQQTEEKTLAVLSSALGEVFPQSAVERAHRLATFDETKCRPAIIKLANFKLKENIFSARPKLKLEKNLYFG